MCQCHDSYKSIEAPGSDGSEGVAVALSGAQCHDSYGSGEPATAPARVVQPSCRFVDAYLEGAHLVRVFGRVDWATADHFRDLMSGVTDAQVVIDLAGATTDSAGTAALMSVVVRARQRGQNLVVVAPDPLQYEVCVAVGLDGEALVARSEREALQWLAEHAVDGSTASQGSW